MNRVGSLCWCELKGVRIVEEIRQSNENKQNYYNTLQQDVPYPCTRTSSISRLQYRLGPLGYTPTLLQSALTRTCILYLLERHGLAT